MKKNSKEIIEDQKEPSYFESRIYGELGVTSESNKVEVISTGLHDIDRRITLPIFEESDKGDIKILVYGLDRRIITYDHPSADQSVASIYNNREQTYYVTRLHPNNVKEGLKYRIPKGVGTYPFFHPDMIEKYEKSEKIKTLVLTEGFFKAYKGAMHGLNIIGLSSITHYKNKKTKSIHPDIAKIIHRCQVENLIMLYDGDCLNISVKALESGEDLSKRPNGFLSSILAVKELLSDFNITIFFAHVNSEIHQSKPKGLDDLLLCYPGKEPKIIEELQITGTPSDYFYKLNVSTFQRKLQGYFNLSSVDQFYGYWSDVIKTKEFIYHGTKYQYIDNKVQILAPKEAKNFIRVGDDYYELVEVPNIMGESEIKRFKRKKQTITDDLGPKITNHIQKYKAFCNIPDHMNYQQVINNCYNTYSRFTHEPEEGDWSFTRIFLSHIFEDQFELGLDYIQLLYQKPSQMLPILCLVSKENNTGKTTFAKYLKELFSENMVIVGNAELANDFNAYIATRLVVCCDETFIEKKTVIENIKSKSTANRVAMQRKGVDHEEVWHFAKYILLSNNEDNFIIAGDEDIRYWVRKIKKPTKDMPDLLRILRDEIPQFLYYLNERKLSTNLENRMWFDPKLIETEALRNVRKSSMPKAEKEIREYIRDQMIDFNKLEVYITAKDIKERTNITEKTDSVYINTILSDRLKGVKITKATRYKLYRFIVNPMTDDLSISTDSCHGKPYIIKAENLLTDQEISNIAKNQEERGEVVPFDDKISF